MLPEAGCLHGDPLRAPRDLQAGPGDGVLPGPVLLLPVHARLGDRAFWPLMLLIAVPTAWVLLRLDRVADRPERLRGLSHDPAPAFPPAVGLGSEVV